MTDTCEKILTALSVPFLLVKWFGWIICAIWLICVGDWRMVLASLLVGWLGGWIFPLVCSLLMLVTFPLVYKAVRSPIFSGVLAAFTRIIQISLLIFWCILCLLVVSGLNGLSHSTVVPRLLLSYCVAIHTIWNVTANTERSEIGIANFLSIVLAALGYLVVIILMFCGFEISVIRVIAILGAFLIWVIPVNVVEVVRHSRKAAGAGVV